MHTNATWSRGQLAKLRAMRERGATFAEISASVGHTPNACQVRASELGIRMPADLNKSRTWTPWQIDQLRIMRERGYGVNAISLVVGHSVIAVTNKASALGLSSKSNQPPITLREPPREKFLESCRKPATAAKGYPKTIPCLNDRCKKPFRSVGPHNRLCPTCRRESLSVYDTPASVLR